MRVGDYVTINEGVWDDQMPKGRRDGLVLEVLPSPDQCMVLFSNGAMLKFHESQITVLKTREQFYL